MKISSVHPRKTDGFMIRVIIVSLPARSFIMSDCQTTIQTNKDTVSKKCKILVLSLTVLMSFFQVRALDPDFYFLYSLGDYIVHHGFPFTDVLSMHSSMKIVVQQWLSSVIFYYVYSFCGKYGVIALIYICNTAVCYITYRLIALISKNDFVALLATALINYFTFDYFMVTRPQIFTYTILLIEFYLLEKHVQTKKSKYLYLLPVLSLLLINLHAAMWLMILIIMLPYIISAVPVHIESFKREAKGDLVTLLVIAALSGVAGLLNPYGIDSMLYLFSSYGHPELVNISEMEPTSLTGLEGKIFFISFAVVCLILCFIKKRMLSIRFFLMFAGTLLIGLMQYKGIPYFLMFGIPAFTYMLSDTSIKDLTKPFKKIITKRVKILFFILLGICILYLCENKFIVTRTYAQEREAYFYYLGGAVDVLDSYEEPKIVYAGFNDGQYLEFRGYHPYLDGRAEIFIASNNKQYDYFTESLCIVYGKYYYRDFVDKYGFNYLIVNEDYDSYLFLSLLYDEDFELVYSEYGVNLFVRK